MPSVRPGLEAELAAIVGPLHVLGDGPDQAPYLQEWRDLYRGRAAYVVRPATADEVSRILVVANREGVGVVPQGGNTGLVGGQVPYGSGSELVLSLARLNRIRHVDPSGRSLVAEAGVTLAAVQRVAEKAGRLFPLSMASEGSATIGGNLATNAGGTAVLAYGTARDLVLGIEVVLADGRIWDGLKALRKDNTGYDLRDVFIGSEGTLGVITAATLRLFRRPAETATALVALPDLEAVARLFAIAEQRAGPELTAFEFLSRTGLELVAQHIPDVRVPFALDQPWYALFEVSRLVADGGAEAAMTEILSGMGDRIAGSAVARSLGQTRELWRLRESLSEAQKREGGSIKHDVSVPVSAIPEFIHRANGVVARVCPGARPVAFGHYGDGNVHYNVSQPTAMTRDAFLALWEPMSEAVHRLVVELGGSISAEHGIGQLKRKALAALKSPVELDLMRRIKAALDPKGIMNPGKVL